MNYFVEYYKSYGKVPCYSFESPFEVSFKLPPEKALVWLKERCKNLKLSIDWDELNTEAHDKAFTVAKVLSADILQLLYDHVEKAKEEGQTLKQFREELLPKLQESGWSGATPSRLKVIYDTNMQMSYAKGKYRQQKLISNMYPFWKYKQIQRATKRHDHSILDGKVFKHDDPIWDLIYPPSGFGCKCSVIPIKDGSQAEKGSDYLQQVKDSAEFQLTPLKAWKPDTEVYVSGIRDKLKGLLKS